MTRNVDDFMEGGSGHPYIKFEAPGSKLVGTLLDARVGVERDYDTGEKKTWPDGSDREQLVLDIEIDWSQSSGITTGKDGVPAAIGTLYCKYLQQVAIDNARKAAECKLSEVGTFAMVRLADGTPRNPRHKPPQQFAAEVARRAASAAADSLLANTGSAPAQEAPATAPSGSLLASS